MSQSKSSRHQLAVFLLRFLISKNEYECLEAVLSPYTPLPLRPHLPSTADFDQRPQKGPPGPRQVFSTRDEFLPATIRQATRVFTGTYLAATLVDVVLIGIIKKHSRKQILANLRNKRSLSTALATSSSIALYRTLRQLLQSQSRVSPAFVAGAVAGLALALHPSDARRVTITIYFLTRTLEFCFNLAEDRGFFPGGRPWWFGSWLLFPLGSAQLLHAFVYDRDCFPKGYGDFILNYSSPYITPRPNIIPATAHWPDRYEIVDSLIPISEMKYPKFYSPTIYTSATSLPDSLANVQSLVNTAHPGIQNLSCAVLHPNEESCTRVFGEFVGMEWRRVGKFIAAVYALIGIVTYRSIKRRFPGAKLGINGRPGSAIPALLTRFLRTTTFITMAIGTSWSSICLFQHLLPSSFLPTKRFYLSGALGGLWAFIDRKKGRGRFLYSSRLSIESAWKVAVKRGYVKPVRGGDVVLFALSLGVLMTVFENSPASVTGGTVRKTMSWVSGRGFVDPVPGADEMRDSGRSSRTTTDAGSSDESPDSGSILLERMGSMSGSDVGEGVRVLEEDLVKSPGPL